MDDVNHQKRGTGTYYATCHRLLFAKDLPGYQSLTQPNKPKIQKEATSSAPVYFNCPASLCIFFFFFFCSFLFNASHLPGTVALSFSFLFQFHISRCLKGEKTEKKRKTSNLSFPEAVALIALERLSSSSTPDQICSNNHGGSKRLPACFSISKSNIKGHPYLTLH